MKSLDTFVTQKHIKHNIIGGKCETLKELWVQVRDILLSLEKAPK